GVVVYALFAGADFGSGFYHLTPGFHQRGSEIPTLADTTHRPVWEGHHVRAGVSTGRVWGANHVWLIYILVMWWTGFPTTFAAATTTLFIPLLLALAGIVLRGATFAFRKYSETFAQ